uniref:ALMS motif domain-containing protein n=1 Tax=Wuchereria bancrofti TaxID=6293 RepID=A0AAF5PL24_WUCBA
MLAEETDLVTHLLADNRKLRQLYLVEQRKALSERKRRITAEARLAALLTKEVIEKKERNLSHCSRLDRDLSIVDKAHKSLLGNGRNPNSIDSSHEGHTAMLVMDRIRKYRRNFPTSASFTDYAVNSVRSVQDANIAESDGRINLSRCTNPLNNKANTSQLSFTTKSPQNFEKSGSMKLSRFWLFIDRNGETKSSVPPPLNQIQQKRKEAFIRRSTERQILIQEASMCRKELAAAKRKVAKQLLAGHTVNRNAVQVLSLMDREICAFPPQAMEHETIRRISKTREFQEKKKRRREEFDAHINRLLAYCYSQVPYRFHQKY